MAFIFQRDLIVLLNGDIAEDGGRIADLDAIDTGRHRNRAAINRARRDDRARRIDDLDGRCDGRA